jgi:hypothetical protein
MLYVDFLSVIEIVLDIVNHLKNDVAVERELIILLLAQLVIYLFENA